MILALAQDTPTPFHSPILAPAQASILAQILAAFLALMLLASVPNMQLFAQGLDADGAIDTIVGSDVTTGEERTKADESRILAAIEASSDNASGVRKKFALDHVEIIFLSDLGKEEGAVEASMAENKSRIVELQEAIQGSAMFYHAIDSRSVLLKDIVALEFDDKNGVTIFVAGSQPGS